MTKTFRAQTWRDYNPILLLAVVLLLAISVPMVYSTTIGQQGEWAFRLATPFSKHLIWIGGGLLLLVSLMLLDYHVLTLIAWPAYLLALGALGAVLALGLVQGGAQSWLGSSSLSFQPTEPAKLALIVALAAFWSRRDARCGSWRNLLFSLLILLAPLGLVAIQPDFGSAMVLVGIWAIMALIAQTRWYQFLLLALLAVPLVIYVWNGQLGNYQKDRLLVFARPELCRQNAELAASICWQTKQASLSFGNGGLSGMGLNHGVLSQRNYLPVQESDFIFAVAAEELGFIGASIIIVLQLIVIWQVWRVMQQSDDMFGRLLVAGIGSLLVVHCWENMGMNMSIMPMTGIPLPFLSYGGSFMLTVLAGIGIVQSVALRESRWTGGG